MLSNCRGFIIVLYVSTSFILYVYMNMRQTAFLGFKSIMVDSYAALFSYTAVV